MKKNCEIVNKRVVSGFNIDRTYSPRCQQTPQLVPIARHPYYYEQKQQKTWFHTKYSKFLDQRKRATLKWLQDSSKIKEDNNSCLQSNITVCYHLNVPLLAILTKILSTVVIESL
jgi:hypothetical protein